VLAHPRWYAALAVDVVALTVWGAVTGYLVHRLPAARLDHDTWLTRPRSWERDGRTYRRLLRVRRWQRRLPEAGRVFGGGIDKRRLGGGGDAMLEAYAVETRRAELVHWLGLCLIPVFVLWNPPGLVAAMVAYGLAANVPCLVSLRSNRLRLERVLAGRRRRASA